MSIAITAASRLVAKISPPRVALYRAVGGFELAFIVDGFSEPRRGEQPIIWLAPDMARIDVGTELRVLGSAPPNNSLLVRTLNSALPFSYEFRIAISASQLAAVEDVRDGEDLTFRMTISGVAGNEANLAEREVWQQVLTHSVPLSNWVQHLRDAKAMDILLLEVPIPFIDPPAQMAVVMKLLRQAQGLFLQAHYTDCVINCRRAIEEFQKLIGRDRAGLLKRLATDRETLDKLERHATIEAAVYHFGNLAVHEGIIVIDRRDARLMLALTAALVAREVS